MNASDSLMHGKFGGNLALHMAARHGGRATVQALVQAGARADAQNALGQTPLHVA